MEVDQATVKKQAAENLGAILLAVVANTYLYGIGTYQYGSYVNSKFKDPLWMKGIVLSLFTIDTVHSLSLIWLLWVVFIERFNQPMSLTDPVWPYPFTIAVNALAACLTQCFLSFRVYRLGRSLLWIAIVIPAAIAEMAFGFFCTYKSWSFSRASQFLVMKAYITAWLTIQTGLDIIICGSLLYILSRSRTGFARSDTVISRLMRGAIQTGTFAGIFSLIALVLFLTKPDTQLNTLLGFPISRIYSNTLMDTILCRAELRELMQGDNERSGLNLSSMRFAQTSVQMQVEKEVQGDRHSRVASSVSTKSRTQAWSNAYDQVEPKPVHYVPPFQSSYNSGDTDDTFLSKSPV